MKPDDLIAALEPCIGRDLADDLVSEFLQIRQDAMTATLGRSSPGKFVETVVQVLQRLSGRNPDPNGKVKVEPFIRECEDGAAKPPEELRLTGARVARAMYALRSKRTIVHKGAVDPNVYDLRLLYHGAQWILAELIRHCMASDMAAAGRMAEYVQAPATELVEDFGTERLVLPSNLTAADELLLLLRHYYPERVSRTQLGRDMKGRDPSTVTHAIQDLVAGRAVHGDRALGYKLTAPGFGRAVDVAKALSERH